MTVLHDRDGIVSCYDRHRAEALRLRHEYVASLLASGRVMALSPRGKLGMFAAAFGLATAAFWATMLTSPPVTEATPVNGIMGAEIERTAPKDAPIQDPGVIACMYVLTEGHDCN